MSIIHIIRKKRDTFGINVIIIIRKICLFTCLMCFISIFVVKEQPSVSVQMNLFQKLQNYIIFQCFISFRFAIENR